MLSRRKSVSFAVCTLDEDTMSFNIERKSVFLGDASRPASNLFVPSSPLLVHMAKKLREVTGKKPRKRPTRLFDRGISIRAGSATSLSSQQQQLQQLQQLQQQQQEQEVIEIYDEDGQLVEGRLVGGKKQTSEVSETEM
jgi:hypothetical protein